MIFIFNIIGIIISITIFIGGMCYYIKEKKDEESRKIYSVAWISGAVIFLIFMLRIFL